MDDRISVFIEEATLVQHSKTKAAELCKKERQTLYKTYSDFTVHYMLTRYRNALRAANLADTYLPLLREPVRKMRANQKRQQADVYERQSHQRPIYDPEALVDHAVTLLDSSSYAVLGLAISLLTGRRDYEVFVTGEFSTARQDPHCVRFTGQAKTRNTKKAQRPYSIPVLTERQKVVDALARLRAMRDFSEYLPANSTDDVLPSRVFHERFGKNIREACTRHFRHFIPNCAPHDLRRVYAIIAYDWFAPPDMSGNRYISEILGHSEHDLGTVQSYHDFYLAESE